MKLLAILLGSVCLAACANTPQPINTVSAPASNERPQTMIAHSSENQSLPAANTGEKTKWTQGGSPIDTTEFDAAVMAAEKALSKKPADQTAKKTLAAAYFKRGFALTDARQYASALGDYRRSKKYDPANPESQKWIDQIITIYDGMNKGYPNEGEEPPSLPFTKGK